MKTEDFENKMVKDQYGEQLTIIEINDNIARVAKGINNLYHTTKIFYKGKSVYSLLSA